MAARKTTTSTAANPFAADTPETSDKPTTPAVTVGRTVLYRMSEEDAKLVNHRRARSARFPQLRRNGEQVHLGNTAEVGDIYPMLVVRVWDNGSVNGQVALDGNDVLWATSRSEGDEPGTWHWPVRT